MPKRVKCIVIGKMTAALVALPVASVPMLAHPVAANPDLIFALIVAHKALDKECSRLFNALNLAKTEAEKTHGTRPERRIILSLDEPLGSGEEWYYKTGIAPQREQYERARDATEQAGLQMAMTEPTTPAGAAAMINYAWPEVTNGATDDDDWPVLSLKLQF